MRKRYSKGIILFNIFNYCFISIFTLLCLIPLVHMLALSFSDAHYVDANLVNFLPKGFTLAAYRYVLKNIKFWTAFLVTFKRLLLGIPIGLAMNILMAYPLSKEDYIFKSRKHYMRIFIFIMIFNGGLVPTYLLVMNLGMLDSIWALVIPSAVNVYNSIIMMNFFRGVPREIEESAMIDGANQFVIMTKLFLPLAKPCIATITLFTFMMHWNSWMDGRIYMNMAENYPLQTYLQGLLETADVNLLSGANISTIVDRMAITGGNLRAAQLFIAMIPVLCIYPILQKHFTAGLVMGSVKG